jgi:hypothetical protein
MQAFKLEVFDRDLGVWRCSLHASQHSVSRALSAMKGAIWLDKSQGHKLSIIEVPDGKFDLFHWFNKQQFSRPPSVVNKVDGIPA